MIAYLVNFMTKDTFSLNHRHCRPAARSVGSTSAVCFQSLANMANNQGFCVRRKASKRCSDQYLAVTTESPYTMSH